MAKITFKGQRCLVTGAASGIGRAVAEALGAEGALLCLTDINEEVLAETALRLKASGATVLAAHALDIADADAVQALADELHIEHGSMDALLNIAGISIWGTVDQLSLDHWRRLININLMGPVHVMHAFLPKMIAAGRGGHLINVSSAAGLFGLPWHAAYSATKFGLRGISEVLRFDLRAHGIHVGLVCPGGVDTGLVRTIEIVGVDREDPAVQRLTARFRRHAVTPEHAAQAILRGMRRRQYMIFTSLDIRIGYWWQRKFALPYEWAMRLLNAYVTRATKK
ncbi:MAG: SDR family oxidoreductase [Alcanivorax sp.]|nr:SDR family oxidoreductase [Alcanivorax sp.]